MTVEGAGLLHWWEAPDGVDRERREVDFLTGNAEVLALALRIVSYQLTTLSLSPIQLLPTAFCLFSIFINMSDLVYLLRTS
jgi:hypothetical protein